MPHFSERVARGEIGNLDLSELPNGEHVIYTPTKKYTIVKCDRGVEVPSIVEAIGPEISKIVELP